MAIHLLPNGYFLKRAGNNALAYCTLYPSKSAVVAVEGTPRYCPSRVAQDPKRPEEEMRASANRVCLPAFNTFFVSNPVLTRRNGLRSSNKKTPRTSCSPSTRIVATSISLPAWEREYERDRGLIGTSYETATVEEVTPVGNGFLRISVDTAVTCTSQTYVSEGQFLFLKPWGDEDGSIEPCCFTMPPGEETVMEFIVPEVSPVGAAALAGEMLEVSEVLGEGFEPHLRSLEFQDASVIMAVCIEQFCAPSLLALRNEMRPTTIFVIAEEQGPFAGPLQDWVGGGNGNRRVHFHHDESSLMKRFEEELEQVSKAAIILSGDKKLCHRTENAVNRLSKGRKLFMLAP